MFALQISIRKLRDLIQRSSLLVRLSLERMAASVTADDVSDGKCQAASA
jgi:hypothetical protein